MPGVPDWLGAVFTVYAAPADSQRSRYAVDGGTYVSVVEFGPTVRAVAVHVFGASANPASPHYFDQAPLYARGEMGASWLALDEIKAHLEKAYRPGEEGRWAGLVFGAGPFAIQLTASATTRLAGLRPCPSIRPGTTSPGCR